MVMSAERKSFLRKFNNFKKNKVNGQFTGNELSVLGILTTFDPIYPSQKRIASCCNICEKTVRNVLKTLENEMFLKKFKRYMKIEGKKYSNNLYVLNRDLIIDVLSGRKKRDILEKHSDHIAVNQSVTLAPEVAVNFTSIYRQNLPHKVLKEKVLNRDIYKADALEEGLEANLASTSQIDNADISRESLNDIDSLIQVAFNAEIELSRLSDLDDDEELLAYARLTEDGPAGLLEDQSGEIIAQQSESSTVPNLNSTVYKTSTVDQAPAKAQINQSNLHLDKPLPSTNETSKNTEIDVIKVIRAWNIVTIPHRLTIMKVNEMPNQKRWQNIRAFSHHLKIDANMWVEIFQYIAADKFWNGKGNAKGQKISKLSFDMILNADRLNNFIDEINHKKEVLAQKRINDIQFLGINTSTDLKKEVEL